MASIFGSKSKSFMTMSIPSQDKPLTKRRASSYRNANEVLGIIIDIALYAMKVRTPNGFCPKPVKAISLPQDVPSTSDRRLIELENQVQRLMEAHLALMQPTQVNKITSSYDICSGPQC
ncbi:hypothetical protein Tco_0760450 [Tanacetum coccineum]